MRGPGTGGARGPGAYSSSCDPHHRLAPGRTSLLPGEGLGDPVQVDFVADPGREGPVGDPAQERAQIVGVRRGGEDGDAPAAVAPSATASCTAR